VVVGAGLGVAAGVALGRGVGVGVGVAVGVGRADGVGAMSQFVGLIVGQGVLDGDGDGVGVGGPGVGVIVGVGVGVPETTGGVGVAGAAMNAPSGEWRLPPLGTQSVGCRTLPMTESIRKDESPTIDIGNTAVNELVPKLIAAISLPGWMVTVDPEAENRSTKTSPLIPDRSRQ
jgi:hypothetical protein